MVFLTVLMCANLASCSKDELGPNGGNNEKKISEMVMYGKLITYSYDNNKRLIKTDKENGDRVYECTWVGNVFRATSADSYSYSFITQEGLFMQGESLRYGEDFSFTYNASGRLAEMLYGERTLIFTWDGDKLMHIMDADGDIRCRFSYNGAKASKGFFPITSLLGETLEMDTKDFFHVMPEYFGMSTKQLPCKITDTSKDPEGDITYTFTKDGYVESCIITDKYGNQEVMSLNWK